MSGHSEAWHSASFVKEAIAEKLEGVNKEVTFRAYSASNELRNASLHILRGQRSGRRYKIPHTRQTYAASAPGEPPANRTGVFRLSWGSRVRALKSGSGFEAVVAIESNIKVGRYLLGDILEGGTSRMKSRPYKEAIRERAMGKIKEIYSKPYKV